MDHSWGCNILGDGIFRDGNILGDGIFTDGNILVDGIFRDGNILRDIPFLGMDTQKST